MLVKKRKEKKTLLEQNSPDKSVGTCISKSSGTEKLYKLDKQFHSDQCNTLLSLRNKINVGRDKDSDIKQLLTYFIKEVL